MKLKMKPRIIINADDFGMNAQVNTEIIRLINERKISSTTLIANSPYIEDAVAFTRYCKDVSFGVHLNLTEFTPFTEIEDIRKYCYQNEKRFNGSYEANSKFFEYKIVYHEWSAQVRFLRKKGVMLSHIDSHHHVHTRPHSFIPLKMVQYCDNIKKVRISRNIIPGREFKSSYLSGRLKMGTKMIWTQCLKSIGVKTSTADFFGSVGDFLDVYQSSPKSVWKDKVIELMCHPGHFHNKYFCGEIDVLDAGIGNVLGFDFDLDRKSVV